MKNIIKSSFLLAVFAIAFTSCSKEEDFEIPPYYPAKVATNFESHLTGSGTTEIAINLPGWSNYTVTGTRKWHARSADGNKYAEFSSFYSASGSSDDQWLILPKLDFDNLVNEKLRFKSKAKFSTGAELRVLISTNFNGTQAGITSANWTVLNPILPSVDDVFTDSGEIDLSSYNGNSVYVAFQYIGSKQAGTTTTWQIDDIKLYEKIN